MADPRVVLVLGALDTKGAEVAYLADRLREAGVIPEILDIGLRSSSLAKADAMAEVANATATRVANAVAGGAAGIIALGGGVGTWIATRVMRELPLGFPKLLVSTLPFDVRHELGASDIMVVPSVADILGLNDPLRIVLRNAAIAIAALASAPQTGRSTASLIGATGLGVTTPAMLALRELIETSGFELVSFHAAGIGGAAFETWVARGMFAGVIDLTTSELTSELFGGLAVTQCRRVTAAARATVPQVVAPGGLDFVTRGPVEALSADDHAKPHIRHSPMFTHVRIDAAGMRIVARELATRLAEGTGPTIAAIPLRGFSTEGRAGGALHDPAADRAFVTELHACAPPHVRIVEIDAHINDAAFARRAWELLQELIR